MNPQLEKCAALLRRHGFDAATVATPEEAAARLMAEVEAAAPARISYGDSMTLRATGIVERLRADGRYTFYDGFEQGLSPEEKIEVRRLGLTADLFLTGINAVSMEGSLHWLDMIGNRIAPVAFGPRKVLLVAGRNKIVATAAEAEERIRLIAAPRNVARHPGFRTPCAKTGVCMDCDSPDRICNTHMTMVRCWPRRRVTVVLVDQDMGL